MPSENGWNEYKKLVVSELERLDEDIKALAKKMDVVKDDLASKIDAIKSDVVVIKTKMGIIGFLSGTIAGAIVATIIKLFVK